MPMFLRQEDHKFRTLLGYIARACFMKERKRKGESERRKGWKKEESGSQDSGIATIILTVQEAEERG